MNPLSLIVLGLAGVAAGPTLHHLAVRAGRHEPFDRLLPGCEQCGERRPIRAWHRGRCASCGASVRGRVLMVSLLSGAVIATAAASAPDPWLIPAWVVFFAVTLVLGITDVDTKLLPNRVLYPGGAAAIALAVAGAILAARAGDLPVAALGGLGYFAVLLAVAVVARGGFGFGDVKLGALVGFFCALEGFRTLLLAVFVTGLAGGLPAIALLITRRAGRGDELPYGPAMIIGAWTALVAGEPLLRWLG